MNANSLVVRPKTGPWPSSITTTQLRIVTTSWDDGDPSDLRIARLLQERKLAGTFYVPTAGRQGAGRLGRSDLLALQGAGFEIGAHGVFHLPLPECDRVQLACEVESCKKQLESVLSRAVRMFAYPGGRYSEAVVQSVKRADYAGARTTRMLARNLKFDPYRMPTTVHAYPHSSADYLRNAARAANFAGAWRYLTRLQRARTWIGLSKLLFDVVMRKGGVWHLYGHSWEISELDLWDDLEEVLNYVCNRPGVLYLSNGGVIDLPASVKNGAHLNGACLAEK